MPLIAKRYLPTGNAAWGGMAEVHECEDQNLKRRVMLKRVPNDASLPRLLDEQKALLKLRSRHVVQLLDVVSFQHNNSEVRCLVLEHIDGEDLDRIKFQPGDNFQKILWQIASGVTDIHAAKIIHRDIKPQNIRRDGNGVLKILDFGLAREVGKDDKTQSIIGTLGFMAPELFGQKTITFSPAVDTYAFGRTALSLLGTQPPVGMPIAIPKGEVLKIHPSLNADIAQILEDCLSLAPADRPSMAEVARTLGRGLLRDKHRARIGTPRHVYELNSASRTAALAFGVTGGLSVHYDGYTFTVTQVNGEVFVNNRKISAGFQMLSACVITIGADPGRRTFVTFDVSNPEIMP